MNEKTVIDACVCRWDNEGLAIHNEADVADETFIEDGVNSGPVK